MKLERYFENPDWLKKAKVIFFILLALLLVADFSIPKEHAVLPGESLPGFYALFGLGATLLIIIISKLLGSLFISKKEGFYND
jgi:hypothetical protein